MIIAIYNMSALSKSPIEVRMEGSRNQSGSIKVLAQFSVQPIVKPKPCDIVFVIDKSGSMDTEAKARAEEPGTQKISNLGLVKFGARVLAKGILSTVNDAEQNTMGIVEYDDRADVTCPLTRITDSGVDTLIKSINNIATRGCTNIYDGLVKGLTLVGKNDPERRKIVYLLTDGQANRGEPGLGYKAALNSLRDQGYDAEIISFGYGYSADTKTLLQLSDGRFCNIPDPNSVAPTCIHALCNTLQTYQEAAKCNVSLENAKFKMNGTRSIDVDIPILQIETTKDVFIPDFIIDEGRDVCRVTIAGVGYTSTFTITPDLSHNSEVEARFMRIPYMKMLEKMIVSDRERCEKLRSQFLDNLLKYDLDESEYGRALIEDLNGDHQLACSDDAHFRKWYRNHLITHLSAHQLQQCHTHHDASVQTFAANSRIWEERKNAINEIFKTSIFEKCDTLPEHSYNRYGGYPAVGGGVAAVGSGGGLPPAPSSGADYTGGTCVTGDSIAILKDSGPTKVENLKVGDVVLTANDYATIIGITIKPQAQYRVFRLPNGLGITAWHPYKKSEWIYAQDDVEAKSEFTNQLYNFVLDRQHMILLNGCPVITMGHNYQEGILKHKYYGSQDVVEDLKKFPSWERGERIVLLPSDFMKDQDGVYGIVRE